ncbi:protein ndvB [Mesorhizobium sp. NBSH29]|uniref:GH36-type glycosyl hydrolase domain-containing protein n=1 Tax=Mesorhizobium sp. NBSH29 TaxID=2654249 RepID=UPI00189684CB|nr:glucoamylase family protein [Mesorhizobium sp. NBSH29]QPC88131.1 protein ndvB [Mesorhizobium sp. NBSH29]
MNLRSDPSKLGKGIHPLPANAELPIRSTFLPDDKLRKLGESLARGELDTFHGLETFDFQTRNRENSAKILEVYRLTNEAQSRGEPITPAAQWLLDNHYLVEETIYQIRRDLPRRFYSELPTINIGGRQVPRALALAWFYVAHADSMVSDDMFAHVVEGYQSVDPLRIGELWALPSLLRFVLIENLRRLALRVNRARELRGSANAVADQVLAAATDDEGEAVLASYASFARDTTFATQLLYRLRDGSQNAGKALVWLESELEKSGSDAEEIIIAEHRTLSNGNVTTGNIIRGLRKINDVDWTEWFEGISRVDALLRENTDFAALDFQSRDHYRTAIEDLARRSKLPEYDVTERALKLATDNDATSNVIETRPADDVGFWLVGPRREELETAIGYRPSFGRRINRSFQHAGWAGIAVPCFLLTSLFLWVTGAALFALNLSPFAVTAMLIAFALPAADATLGLFNTMVLLFLKPTRLVGYEYKAGLSSSERTLVVVPALIGSREDIEENLRNLEVHYLANGKGDVRFALLSDWADSDVEQKPSDLQLLDFARAEVGKLNALYPMDGTPRFHVLHRRRLYNEAEGCWMGWERKRGKLHELNRLLRGDPDTTFLPLDAPLPDNVVYVMTLDADTRTTRDAVTRLVGKLAHPLNHPITDPKSGRVIAGYGILQPRVTASLTTGDDASFFQRAFSANRGLDPYVFAVSDLYQDVFGDGTFTGKGLYHIDAMEAALAGRIAENTVLSHDLLEGSWARSALVTDVEVVEDYPTHYTVDASRHHRWARGDWQLLPFIFKPRSGVPALSRWKMVDNLRRSLTPIAWVLASIAGWGLLPFSAAVQWQALLILSMFIALTFDVVDSLLPSSRETTVRGHLNALFRDIAFGTAQVALKIVLIADNAWSMGDAIVRTLYRMLISRKNLLEWKTASQAGKSRGTGVGSHYATMYGAVVIGVLGPVPSLLNDSSGFFLGLIFSAFWILSPAFAWLVSRSAETEDRLEIADSDRWRLRSIARRTWHYFETFVTAEHNMLPPDNFQETPVPVVAPRTSPTNIGVYLLSVVSARDFGWISLADAISRIDATMATIERMERHRGHLYNWYETTTLKPLLPLYISSVDSGNLAGHLIAVAAACQKWAESPAVHLQGDFDGLLDTLSILEESLDSVPDDRRQLRPLRKRLRDRAGGMRRAVETIKNEPELASIRTINLAVIAAELKKLADTIHSEIGMPRSEELAGWAARLEATCEAHVQDSHSDQPTLAAFRKTLEALRERARKYAFEMNFSFLLREDRKLLSIGYRVTEQQLDESCYDLLASEARLTSLFAIAKGDIQTEHWFRLGRPLVEIGFRGALMSWAGSMFEYLMPPLVMKEPQGGILNQTNHLIIQRQIQYARSRNIPWGISEAAYNGRDREMTYQYTNFGVPGLGLKRGLAQNMVIAPYATVLAAQFMPRQAVDNLQQLRLIGALGRYGYYDAVDFTPQRVPDGDRRAIVYNYMAHHQGMSIVAIANAVFEGRMRDRFHSDPVIEAAELLLQEKAPRDIPVMLIKSEASERTKVEVTEISPDTRIILNPLRALRSTNVMSNGHYSVMVTATGSGYSRWNDLAVTRWHPDPTEDRLGSYLFIRDRETGDWWSATAEPKQAPGETLETIFADDKATFVKTVGTLRSEVECIVIAEGNGEGRRIVISNEGPTDRVIEVTSFAELSIAPEITDSAHPAFSKMFVKTEISKDRRAIFATRRKRDHNDPDIAYGHFVSGGSGFGREVEAETDRRAFIGRGRTIASAAAFDPGAKLGGSDGFVLDPVASIRRKIRVPSRKKVTLTFWTVVGANREEVDDTISRLDHREAFSRQAMLSWTASQVQTRHIGLTLTQAANVQKLARYLLYPDPSVRAQADTIAAGMGSQSTLWPMSISGDYPIFVLRIGDQADLEIVAQALRFQEYMRSRGLLADLVILNEQSSSYVQDLQQAIEFHCENGRLRGRELGPRQHIFAVRRDLMDDTSYRTLIGAAHIVFHTRNGTIFDQLERAEATALATRDASLAALAESASVPKQQPAIAGSKSGSAVAKVDPENLLFWNGFGGFDRDGRDYVVKLGETRATPQPWINVIANTAFGFHTSAEGASFSWSRNSRDFQLTPWSNDPVTNRPGEAIYIHDRQTGASFSPFAAVAYDPAITYEARHGQGFSKFSAKRGDLSMELTQVVDPVDPIKIQRLVLRNRSRVPQVLRVYAYAEWVLGTNRARTAPYIVPSQDKATGALLARNSYNVDYADRVAFLASDKPADSVTADRHEFVGARGSVQMPETVIAGAALSNRVDAGVDPCAALARDVDIPAGGEVTMLWMLGDAASDEEVSSLIATHSAKDFDSRLVEIDREWRGFLDTLQVETPDPAFNAIVNHWLPYQSLTCRIRARSAFYQASGAFGFRDQLQDTLSLLLHEPKLAHAQILNAAGRQFPEGDVQHWWLPRTGAGVRTLISDDVVWLGYGTAYYIKVTGDTSILDEDLAFIEGEALKPGQHDAFYTPKQSQETAPLYEHMARALDLAIVRSSPDGLPLILGGDWNDGMNRVGGEGRGESVWLGWFLLKTLDDCVPLAEKRGDTRRAKAWRKHAKSLKKALEAHAWDGEWYRRGSFDDGSPLGSHLSDECQIDSLAQSWSVLSGQGDPARSQTAMNSAMELLVDSEQQIVKLFTPPFANTEKEPGYIKSYPAGVRENGGQYTHAATWFVIALAEMGRVDDAWRCFEMLNPINHARDASAAEKYRVEPYVVAADIYSGDDKGGRGGWTWYTGSAGWLYRAATEGILGIHKEGNSLRITPHMPSHWDSYTVKIKQNGAKYNVKVSRKNNKTTSIEVNGKKISGDTFNISSPSSSKTA